jgi:hypothetical protein
MIINSRIARLIPNAQSALISPVARQLFPNNFRMTENYILSRQAQSQEFRASTSKKIILTKIVGPLNTAAYYIA